MSLATTLLLTTHLLAPPQPVDFRLTLSVPAPGPAGVTRTPTGDLPAGPAGSRADAAPQPRRASPPSASFTPARGFGTDVPLSFAARQIVPAGLRVRYGDGVETDALVSWVGDKPWNRALQDAIRPLGLRMALAEGVVTILR